MAIATRKSAEQDHFDLLPFIGIMMCLLGALLLVTMSAAAINVGIGAGEGWIPQPTIDEQKTPVLIEWDGHYATWHSETGLKTLEENFIEYAKKDGQWIRWDEKGSGRRVDGPQPNPLDPLVTFLESRRQTHYALFAVRPSGFKTFLRFASRFEDRDIQIGSEPVDQAKPVRLILPKRRVQ